MLNTFRKLVPSAVWLLSALFVSAFLDRLPDPPALQWRFSRVRLESGSPDVASREGGELPVGGQAAVALPVIRQITLWRARGTKPLEKEMAVLLEAADTSPPFGNSLHVLTERCSLLLVAGCG